MELERLAEIAKIQSTEASNEIEGIRTINTRLKWFRADKTAPRHGMSVKLWAAEICSTLSTRTMSTFLCVLTITLQLYRDLCRYSEKGIGGSFKTRKLYQYYG